MKVDGGILEIIMREIEVECLPGDIPERIEVDVTDLGLHGAIRVSDLPVNDKVKVLDDRGPGRRPRRLGEGRSCASGCRCSGGRRSCCSLLLPSPKS